MRPAWMKRGLLGLARADASASSSSPSLCPTVQDNRVGELADIHTYGIKKTYISYIWPQYAYVPQDGDRKGALTHPTPAAEGVKIWLGSVKCLSSTLTPHPDPLTSLNLKP
jgi:hypothetical protein